MVRKGDIVRVKTFDELVKEFGQPDENGAILCGYTFPNPKSSRKVANYFTEDMRALCGAMGYVANADEPHKILLHDARYLDPDFVGDDNPQNWMYDFSEQMFVVSE